MNTIFSYSNKFAIDFIRSVIYLPVLMLHLSIGYILLLLQFALYSNSVIQVNMDNKGEFCMDKKKL